MVDLLSELGIRGTFFIEGELVERWSGKADLPGLLRGHEVASHAYAHEDLTGGSTGLPPSPDVLDAIIGRSAAAIEDAFGRRPAGFRAPYLHFDDRIAEALVRRSFRYDSSLFADLPGGPRCYRLPSGLAEVPLAQERDDHGRKLQSYLWPMHEGKRRPADYHRLMRHQEGGITVLADHTWHIVEGRNGLRTDEEIVNELDLVRQMLQGALDSGIEFMTLEEHVRSISW